MKWRSILEKSNASQLNELIWTRKKNRTLISCIYIRMRKWKVKFQHIISVKIPQSHWAMSSSKRFICKQHRYTKLMPLHKFWLAWNFSSRNSDIVLMEFRKRNLNFCNSLIRFLSAMQINIKCHWILCQNKMRT